MTMRLSEENKVRNLYNYNEHKGKKFREQEEESVSELRFLVPAKNQDFLYLNPTDTFPLS